MSVAVERPMDFQPFSMNNMLDSFKLEDLSIEGMIENLFKLAMANRHEGANVQKQQKALEKTVGIELRGKIKDSYNSYKWMAAQVLGMGVSAGGLGVFGYQALNSGASAAKAALEASQLASSLTQPFSQYFSNSDESARSSMQSEDQALKAQNGTTSQEISSAEQNEEQLRQQLKDFYDKMHQAFGQQAS